MGCILGVDRALGLVAAIGDKESTETILWGDIEGFPKLLSLVITILGGMSC